MKKVDKKAYPPCIGCAYLASLPSGTGYICGALTELLCVTRGTCKFEKRGEKRNER